MVAHFLFLAAHLKFIDDVVHPAAGRGLTQKFLLRLIRIELDAVIDLPVVCSDQQIPSSAAGIDDDDAF